MYECLHMLTMQTGHFQITLGLVLGFLRGEVGVGKNPYKLLTTFWNHWFLKWTQWDSSIIFIIVMYFSYFCDYSFVHTFKDQIRTPANHAGTWYLTDCLWFSNPFHSCYLPEYTLPFHVHKTMLFTADTLSSIWGL